MTEKGEENLANHLLTDFLRAIPLHVPALILLSNLQKGKLQIGNAINTIKLVLQVEPANDTAKHEVELLSVIADKIHKKRREAAAEKTSIDYPPLHSAGSYKALFTFDNFGENKK